MLREQDERAGRYFTETRHFVFGKKCYFENATRVLLNITANSFVRFPRFGCCFSLASEHLFG